MQPTIMDPTKSVSLLPNLPHPCPHFPSSTNNPATKTSYSPSSPLMSRDQSTEHKPKKIINFSLLQHLLLSSDINTLSETTAIIRSKGCFNLFPFCWSGEKCGKFGKCGRSIAQTTRDWRKMNKWVKLTHIMSGTPRFVQGVSLKCKDCNQFILSIDNDYTQTLPHLHAIN